MYEQQTHGSVSAAAAAKHGNKNDARMAAGGITA